MKQCLEIKGSECQISTYLATPPPPAMGTSEGGPFLSFSTGSLMYLRAEVL